MAPTEDSNHEEWDLLYAAGLPVPRIAELTGALPGTIHRHFEGRRIADPSLVAKRAAAPKGPSKAWRKNLESLRDFISKYGRFPAIRGEEAGEQQLYGWLAAQRHALISQTLGWSKMQAMSVLGDWVTTDLEREWERRWHERLGQVVDFTAEHGRMPSYRHVEAGIERTLGIWGATQHHETLHGRISVERLAKLDAELPGWRRNR